MDIKIRNLNLDPIIVKSMCKEEGKGWTLEYAKTIAEEYRKFLQLCLDYADEAIAPSNLVDDFWHLHILDT